jgi:hypothetical protein
VKRGNSCTGETELSESEVESAPSPRKRYRLYRVFFVPSHPSHYEVAVLRDRLHSNAETSGQVQFDSMLGRILVFDG